MATTDPRVDAYIQNAAPFARPILVHIRESVHAGCPEVEETMKWSFPHFVYKGMLCSMAAFKAHCSFGFWKGSLLDVPPNGTPMSQFGRITAVDDLPRSKELTRLVRQAAALNDDGVKIARPERTASKAPPKTPGDLQKALKTNAKASANFKALSPSHKREYIEWITEAKTEATRKKRMATTVEWLSQGKSRNWKYERKK
ncbi:MAG TPA: YdeI/OmpD-associated family protein [Vicinamibacterales bacterium]|nr:YdeI/OmpD-associated family protein [Vicinamibacterales bacterium]